MDIYKMQNARHNRSKRDKNFKKFFANGFTAWYETMYEVAVYLERARHTPTTLAAETAQNGGSCALYSLAEDFTDEFEMQYKGVKWGEDENFGDWIDTLWEWLDDKNRKVERTISAHHALAILKDGGMIRVRGYGEDYEALTGVTMDSDFENGETEREILEWLTSYPELQVWPGEGSIVIKSTKYVDYATQILRMEQAMKVEIASQMKRLNRPVTDAEFSGEFFNHSNISEHGFDGIDVECNLLRDKEEQPSLSLANMVAEGVVTLSDLSEIVEELRAIKL